MVLRRCRWGEL